MTCHHICACGAELRCKTDPDKCIIGPYPWQCENCDFDEFDKWIESQRTRFELINRMTPAPEQEKDK